MLEVKVKGKWIPLKEYKGVTKHDTGIPKELEPLLVEARKYKNANDFIETLSKSIDDYTEGDFLTAAPK